MIGDYFYILSGASTPSMVRMLNSVSLTQLQRNSLACISGSFSTLTRQGDYYINHVRCNIWIEGEDAEARLAMVGGKFTANLRLGLKN